MGMDHEHQHLSHPKLIARLKRAQGHLGKVISMLEEGRSCTETAQQLHAVESAITNAKRLLIHDHIDHCMGDSAGNDLQDLREITKYL